MPNAVDTSDAAWITYSAAQLGQDTAAPSSTPAVADGGLKPVALSFNESTGEQLVSQRDLNKKKEQAVKEAGPPTYSLPSGPVVGGVSSSRVADVR